MNGNSELTETENVIFYVSYGVLTEFLRINVILPYFCNGQQFNGTDTGCCKSGVTLLCTFYDPQICKNRGRILGVRTLQT